MLKRKCQALSQKLAELGVEADQHRAVVDTLKVLDADRKCFRLVGGVLVERKVGDTLPELQETQVCKVPVCDKDCVVSAWRRFGHNYISHHNHIGHSHRGS